MQGILAKGLAWTGVQGNSYASFRLISQAGHAFWLAGRNSQLAGISVTLVPVTGVSEVLECKRQQLRKSNRKAAVKNYPKE